MAICRITAKEGSVYQTLSPLRSLAILIPLVVMAPPTMADQVKGFGCPAEGDPYEYEQCFDERGNPKPGFPKQTPKPFDGGEDVNGDGKKDRLGSTMSDLKGNKVECWCLQKSPRTAQQFAYAFVPAGGGRKWFGGCYYGNGDNNLVCKGEVETRGPNRGKIKEYTSVCQDNIDYGPDRSQPPTGKEDKHFKYYNEGDNKGKVQKFKTEGAWERDGTGPDGKPKYKYKETKRTACPIVDPPAQPQDLLAMVLEPDQLPDALANGLGGIDRPKFTLLSSGDNAPMWEFKAYLPAQLGFLDVSTEAWLSVNTKIHPGDELTITGSGIQAAWMAADAARVGGWALVSQDDQHARFVATRLAEPETGEPFASFFVFSEAAAGTIRWAYMGTELGLTGEASGPAGEPGGDIEPVDPPEEPIRPVADAPLRPANEEPENNEPAGPAPRTPRQDPP
jgi:hypothetical protein